MVKAADLFQLKQTEHAAIHDGSGYAWEALKTAFLIRFLVLGVVLLATTGQAQLNPVAIPPGAAKFLDPTNEFSATAIYSTETFGATTNEVGSVELKFYFSKGRFRTDVDMTQYKNFQYPVSEEQKENWRKHGMAEAVTIYNLSKGEVWDIRPKQRGAFGRSLTKQESEQLATWPDLTQVAVGREVIDSHPCTRYRVTFQKEDKEPRVSFWELYEWSVEGFVWRADEMNGFPVQVKWKGQRYSSSLRFKDIQIGVQDSALFELPKDDIKPNRFQFRGWPGQSEIFSSASESQVLEKPNSER